MHGIDVRLAFPEKLPTFGHSVMYSLRVKHEAKTHSIMTSHVSITLPIRHLLKRRSVALGEETSLCSLLAHIAVANDKW